MIFLTGYDMKNWRQEHGLTQKDLADKIGYAKDRISHLETDNGGKNRLSKRMQKALTDLDDSLSDTLIYAWRRRITDTTFTKIFSDELTSLGKVLSRAIDDTPKTFRSTVAYLELLTLYIETFLQVTHSTVSIKSSMQKLIIKSKKYRNKYPL